MSETATITAADFEAAAAPAATTEGAASTPDSASTSTAAPTTAAPSEPDLLTDPSWGDIPAARRPSIADNFRKRAEADRQHAIATAKQEWENQHWAKGITSQEAAVIREWSHRGNTDPAGLVMDLLQRVQSDPTHGPRLRSEAARILSSGRQPQAVEEEAMPPPDIPTDASHGEPVVYSAKQLALRDAWLKKQFLGDVQRELQPFQQDLQTRRQIAEVQALQQKADAYGSFTIRQLADQPGFKDHKAAIAQEYAAMGVRDPRSGQIVPDPNDPRAEGEKLRDAYLKVVLPTLSSAARQQTVADLHRKASASTVNPAAASSHLPFDYDKASMEEALAYEFNRRKRVGGL